VLKSDFYELNKNPDVAYGDVSKLFWVRKGYLELLSSAIYWLVPTTMIEDLCKSRYKVMIWF
jgi:hypothetical protein